MTCRAIVYTLLSDAVSADITVHRGQEREREHLAWEEVMEIHDVKNKKGGGKKKNDC